MPENTHHVMVLDDNETYSGLRGCYATLVAADDPEDIERAIDEEQDQALFFIHDTHLGIIIELTDLGRQRVRVI